MCSTVGPKKFLFSNHNKIALIKKNFYVRVKQVLECDEGYFFQLAHSTNVVYVEQMYSYMMDLSPL